MLWRGRLTIAAIVLVLSLALHALFGGEGGEAAASTARERDAAPVAAVGAFPKSAPDGDRPAPDAMEPTLPEPAAPPAAAPAASPAPARTVPARGGAVPEQILGRVPIPLPGAGRTAAPRLIAARGVPRGAPRAQVARGERVVEFVPVDGGGQLRVEYTLDAELTDAVYDIFSRGRVRLGLAVVLDPATGEVLAYAATDPSQLSPTETYPAASLVKVVTAAAALETVPGVAYRTCHFVGSPYRLTPSRIVPPARGTEITLERALATSNNQCFAQLAVNDLGATRLLDTFRRFGLLQPPGPGHPRGEADSPDGDRFALGKLGCGLAGLRITSLHAAEIAATLSTGKRVAPRWIARVTDASGKELALPQRVGPETVLPADTATRLRDMMTETTLSGTARRAFRGRYGRPLLREMNVAGKTGSLSGTQPPGRYEWFIGLAPANHPKIAIAVLVVQQKRWHTNASTVAAEVLNAIFCNGSVCDANRANQWLSAARVPAASSATKRAVD